MGCAYEAALLCHGHDMPPLSCIRTCGESNGYVLSQGANRYERNEQYDTPTAR